MLQGRRAGRGIGALALALAAAGPLAAQEEAGVTRSYGYTNFGELKYPESFEHLDYVNPDAPKGGEISIWAQGNFDSFNQYAMAGVPAALNTIGTERIMTSFDDDPYGLYCLMCTSLEYPEDLSWVTFHLRDDVTFQDGTPVTAEDIAFTSNLFLTQGIPEYRRIVEGFYESVEVIDPHTIKFTFKPDSSRRDRIGLAGTTPVFSKAWFEAREQRLDESTLEPFMSTGPYVLDSYDFNRRVVYKRNPDYWGEDLPLNRGRNNFDRIRVEYFGDTDAAFEGFKSGEYTFRIEDKAQNWAERYDFPNIQNGSVIKEEIPDGSVGTRLSWVFNLDREKWQDKRVREAIGLAFNFEWTNRTIFYDLYTQPVSYWFGTDLAATGAPSDGERALLQPLVEEGLFDADILTEEAVVPEAHDPGSNRISRGALREAGKLLEEAGWTIGDDGIRRNAQGQPLELVIIQTNPTYDRMVNPFLQNLQLMGVQGRLERVDTSQYVERRRSGAFDLANQAFAMDFEPSLGLFQWYGSATADDSSRNLMRLRNEGVDRLLQEVLEAKTLDDLKTATRTVDRALRHTRFDIPLWYNDKTFVAHYDMYGHPETMPPLALGQFDFWWYDQEGADALRAKGVLR
ncbi:extracellular solute-binding protein [Mangrovicoccus algicola]|uniref:ABC transporter substrate-binding protein n=1 Tax=Mangrovicoccus algicola TaxID=2771008 RepID=A0A8J7CUI1_9RHOB|nr:extracellular solute-binding protein [Mangrovicoccus algicola]MBE3637529.1 ABC transporter substrate-binding protein [Mangrovicoccus algicola]